MDRDREITLVRDCQQGDRQALSRLVKDFEKPVYNVAYRILGNVDEAADVTQTAFLRVFENIQRYNPKFRFFSWIYRIAINEAIDQLNRRKRLEPLAETPGTDSPPDTVATSQLCNEVQVTLMELNEDHRTVIVLRYFSDCSYRQIGEILQLPEKTVKSRLFTARQQMKKQLQQHGVVSA